MHQDVLWFQVTVYDTFTVQVYERFAELIENFSHRFLRKSPFFHPLFLDIFCQVPLYKMITNRVLTGEILHDYDK